MKKPVFEITLEDIEKYEYYTVKTLSRSTYDQIVILASNSLINLKKEIKNRGWRTSFICTNVGCFAYNQRFVDEMPYIPRYGCDKKLFT